ncbi:hypothetical protein AJ79_05175 [Helicocarpus griseus UAMH5409]|uniref:Uncharacterized protein n=1 Tax=Helicocarpus griseus UAMH5409 TaxID=1447875 RepID=A0A2B7XPP2_9EURO|nr:hypothetical protein AJ79_05175 [Helicocarpus griseus UAMH5409]
MHGEAITAELGEILELRIRGYPKYTGIHLIDHSLALIIGMFSPGVMNIDRANSIQRYFLFSLSSPIAIFTVEAFKKRNSMTLISWTSIWALLHQCLGIGAIGPFYFAAYMLASGNEQYWWPLSRQVPTPYSKSLLPALIVGYVLPTAAMYYPYTNISKAKGMIAFWQGSPVYVNILIAIFAWAYRKLYQEDHRAPEASKPLPDMQDLRALYLVSFAISACSHFSTAFTIFRSTNPELSLTRVFVPTWAVPNAPFLDSLRNLWLADFWICFLAAGVWCWMAVWDMNRVGHTKTDMLIAAAMLVGTSVCFGPGAMTAGCWYWREAKMARVSFS